MAAASELAVHVSLTVYCECAGDAQNAKALQSEIDQANKLKKQQQIKDAAFENSTNTATSVH